MTAGHPGGVESHVCVLADHVIAGHGIRRCLAQACPSPVVQVACIRDALRSLRELPVGLAVIHVDAANRSALEAVLRLKARQPAIRTLVFVGRQELRCAPQLRSLRPEGYVTKTGPVAEIVQAARAVHAGRSWCPDTLPQFAPDAPLPAQPHHRLTPREFLVFCELARGSGPAGIRKTFSLGPARLAQYRARIFEQLQVDSDAALTQYAIRHELID